MVSSTCAQLFRPEQVAELVCDPSRAVRRLPGGQGDSDGVTVHADTRTRTLA